MPGTRKLGRATDHRIATLRNLVTSHLENNYIEEITVEHLAKMCNMSQCNFRRYFKKYSDMSPITYRNYLRIIKARDLLQTGEYNVTEAAAAVNIPDNCYFHKLFRQFLGSTPKSTVDTP